MESGKTLELKSDEKAEVELAKAEKVGPSNKTRELINAIKAYMTYFAGAYESPAINEARNRVEKAIDEVQKEN